MTQAHTTRHRFAAAALAITVALLPALFGTQASSASPRPATKALAGLTNGTANAPMAAAADSTNTTNAATAAALASAATVTAADGTKVVPLVMNFALDRKVIYQPSTGEWSWNDPVDQTPLVYQFGQEGDIPVIGDFNGNAATHDLAVWRPSTGVWDIWFDAGRGIHVSKQWGLPGDIPVVGDFNGNSKDDLTVYRPSEGRWYVYYDGAMPNANGCQPLISNSGCTASFGWGVSGDIPLAGDFNVSGADDFMIYRPWDGTWWVWYDGGTGTQVMRQWGLPGDIPVPGEYGWYPYYATDIAVYRPTDSTWWIWHDGASLNPGPTEVKFWGQPGDIPLRWRNRGGGGGLAFCQDGRTNCPTVFRPSTNTRYVQNPSQPVTMPPGGYGVCASEGETCSYPGAATVAYGANGIFAWRNFTGSIACSWTVFGDPVPGVPKLCFVRPAADSTSVNPGVYTLSAVHSGKCLDVAGVSLDNGGYTHQWVCYGGNNQKWRLVAASDRLDLFNLIAVHSGRCLEVNGASLANGASAVQRDCLGGAEQQWTLSPVPGVANTFTVVSASSGKCLDVYGASIADGGVVYQWDCHGGTNQQWVLTPTS